MANNLATLIPVLRELKDSAGGFLPPTAVVAAARDPNSPLHQYFTWDDGEAADKCRLAEAGMLIRRVRIHLVRVPRDTQQVSVNLVRVDRGVRSFRMLQAPRGSRGKDGGYRDVVDIVSDENLTADMVNTLRGDLIGWVKRAQEFCDAASAQGVTQSTLQSVVDAIASVANEAWPAVALDGGTDGRGDEGGIDPSLAS
jgi:hypothetical protein